MLKREEKALKKINLIAALSMALSSWSSLANAQKAVVNPGTPVPDCSLHVNIDRYGQLPGYSATWGHV